MDLRIRSNMLMQNANRHFQVSSGLKSKEMEKLASGYQINRASDDAAKLSLSEKMRRQIRGLDQGSVNAQDGISWVQIGDGSLNEVDDMLHRMEELTIKSLNGNYSANDRAMMEEEFEQLQSEIDRLTNGTKFNSMDIFDEHEKPFYQYEGNMKWQHHQRHVITDGSNDLVIEYRIKEGEPAKRAEITVPAGEYTTQELIDEIDSALSAAGLREDGLVMEYTQHGTCNMNLEGGIAIDDVGGGLSYLLYDSYDGGSLGALIGTTIFPTESSQLFISRGNNDSMSFIIEGAAGTVTKSLTIPQGIYTRGQLIDLLNYELRDTTVRASKYGTGIKLASGDSIISGFKGNMFKIDSGANVYTSVFYDNVKYGEITLKGGYFTGGMVMTADNKDVEHGFYQITKDNQTLTIAANGGNEVKLEIPEGSYNIYQMVTTLQGLFDANNLDLTASVATSNKEPGYQGIHIASNLLGRDSEVKINAGQSSAYETLFIRHPYTDYKTDAENFYVTKNDVTAYIIGNRVFGEKETPLKIEAGKNDSFVLTLTDVENNTASYTITLKPGEYKDAATICAEIDDKLNGTGAPAGYKGQLKVEVSQNCIMLTETGKKLTDIQLSAVSGNQGYVDIWSLVKETVDDVTASGTGTSSAPATITLNTPVSEPVVFDNSNRTMQVVLDGAALPVTFPTGSLTYQQIVDEINRQLTAGTAVANYRFSPVDVHGTETDKNFKLQETGRTTIKHQTYENTGTSEGGQQGTAGIAKNTAAKVTIGGMTIPASIEINSSNNYFQFVLNGETKRITLAEKTYTRNELIGEMQAKINAACGGLAGNSYGGVTVGLDSSNHLTLTAGLVNSVGAQVLGSSTSISCSTNNNNFLYDLHAVKSTVSITSKQPLKSSITIDGSNNTLSFNMKVNGILQPVDLTLTSGTYSRSSLVAELNRKLSGYGVTADLDGNNLRLTAAQKGWGSELTYDSSAGGSAAKALFGELVEKTPAKATLNRDIQQPVVIDGSGDTLSVTVNGVNHTIQLDHRTYPTRQELVDQINTKLAAKGAGLTATLDGNRIHYETTATGNDATLVVSYDGGGSAMKAIYGGETFYHEGVRASFSSDGRLILTRDKNGGSISVSSTHGSVFQLPVVTKKTETPYRKQGVHPQEKAYINGVSLSSPVKIDQWNNDMSFIYCDNGTRKSVQFQLAEKDYTFAELEAALKQAINVDGNAANLKVTVTNQGVRIEALNPGNGNYIKKSDFSGGFFYKVLCSSQEKIKESNPDEKKGSQSTDTAYVVGRKDVKNCQTKIQAGVNDKLSLDFTYGGATQKFTMTLDAGTYNGNDLKRQIQEKLNEQLRDAGLEENLIEVGLGDINTGITGANDKNALNFRLSSTATLPGNGEYLIDGVSGTAAFSVFYQTDGEIALAYVKGARDISGGTVIKDGETEFSFDVDGVNYKLDIPAGTYTQTEIIDRLNGMLQGMGAPVTAIAEDGNLKLQHVRFGEHKIMNISGPAKKELFFTEAGEDGERGGIPIQCGGDSEDCLIIDKPVLNTVSLGINSVVITRPRYAEKALERLKQALNRVSDVRGYFGSMQNRLGHTIDNNGNRVENTTAAESRARDTDMAKGMMRNSTYHIVQNASQAIMAHARQRAGDILDLLR